MGENSLLWRVWVSRFVVCVVSKYSVDAGVALMEVYHHIMIFLPVKMNVSSDLP